MLEAFAAIVVINAVLVAIIIGSGGGDGDSPCCA